MIPVLFQLPPITIFGLPIQLTIYSFGLMMALGAIVGNLVLTSECRRRGYNPDFANAVVVWGAIAGIAGARIYDVFDNWPLYRANPWSIFFSGAGFIWYGGLVAGILATLLVASRYKVPILTALDMCAPALILGQAFGRMGCQLSGDGVSACDRRLERAERPQARRSEPARFRLLSGRPRTSGARIRSDSVRLNLPRIVVVA